MFAVASESCASARAHLDLDIVVVVDLDLDAVKSAHFQFSITTYGVLELLQE